MSEKKPMVLVLAGPNGSGKSTITQYFDKIGTYTNADDIVAATGMSNQEAAVLSSQYKIEILKKAKESGYFIKCVFMLTVDPEVNVARVATRVASGGHDVEKSKIIERYYKAVANIPQLMELCDILHIYDNTITPVRIVRKHKDDISIFPNDLWPEAKIIELIGE